MSLASDNLRSNFKKGDDIRDEGLTTPEDVIRFNDIPYGTEKLDLYKPKDAEGKLPVIISVHGGGWVYGDKERYQYYCLSLAERGFSVVNFTYRLAPEAKFPAALEDTNLVARWVLENADEYSLDTNNIFAVGDSAGAHYLSLYAAILTNPEYAKGYPFKVPEGFRLKAIALDCGAYSLSTPDTKLLMKDLLPGGGTPEELSFIIPLDYITHGYPPVFYFTAPGDFLKSDAPKLGAKLMEKDVRHEFRYFTSPEEHLGHVFNLNIRSKAAKECNDAQAAFFRQFLDA